MKVPQASKIMPKGHPEDSEGTGNADSLGLLNPSLKSNKCLKSKTWTYTWQKGRAVTVLWDNRHTYPTPDGAHAKGLCTGYRQLRDYRSCQKHGTLPASCFIWFQRKVSWKWELLLPASNNKPVATLHSAYDFDLCMHVAWPHSSLCTSSTLLTCCSVQEQDGQKLRGQGQGVGSPRGQEDGL